MSHESHILIRRLKSFSETHAVLDALWSYGYSAFGVTSPPTEQLRYEVYITTQNPDAIEAIIWGCEAILNPFYLDFLDIDGDSTIKKADDINGFWVTTRSLKYLFYNLDGKYVCVYAEENDDALSD